MAYAFTSIHTSIIHDGARAKAGGKGGTRRQGEATRRVARGGMNGRGNRCQLAHSLVQQWGRYPLM